MKKDKEKFGMRLGIVIVLVIIVVGAVSLILNQRNKENQIQSELVYTGKYEGNERFVQILIHSQKELEEDKKEYGIDKDFGQIDFNQNSIFICSKHSAKRFSYSKKNSNNKHDLLDVVFDKQEKNEIYAYVLKKQDLLTWEMAGAYKEDSFE